MQFKDGNRRTRFFKSLPESYERRLGTSVQNLMPHIFKTFFTTSVSLHMWMWPHRATFGSTKTIWRQTWIII